MTHFSFSSKRLWLISALSLGALSACAPLDGEADEEAITEELSGANCTVTSGGQVGSRRVRIPPGNWRAGSWVDAIIYEARGSGSGCASVCSSWINAERQRFQSANPDDLYRSFYSWNGSSCFAGVYEQRQPPFPMDGNDPPDSSEPWEIHNPWEGW